MNKYHNWLDTCVKFSPQNSMLLCQTNIFLSILNMRPTWIYHWKACDTSYIWICITQFFLQHKCLAFCFARSYKALSTLLYRCLVFFPFLLTLKMICWAYLGFIEHIMSMKTLMIFSITYLPSGNLAYR